MSFSPRHLVCSLLRTSTRAKTIKATSSQSRITPVFLIPNHHSLQRKAQRAHMATDTTASKVISEVAHAEGGTTRGSLSAQMQSEFTKQRNAEQAAASDIDVSDTVATNDAASKAISEVAHAEGGTTKGSLSAQMQSEFTKQQNAEQSAAPDVDVPDSMGANDITPKAISEIAHAEGGTSKGSLSAEMQSQYTKQHNAKQAVPTNDDGSTTRAPNLAASDAISEAARAEGGTSKGSRSARMQSEYTRQRNAEKAASFPAGGEKSHSDQAQADLQRNFDETAQAMHAKMENDPASVTIDDARVIESRESRVMGRVRPPPGSISAEVKRMAAINAKDKSSRSTSSVDGMSNDGTDNTSYASTQASVLTDRSVQGQLQKEANFQEAANETKAKIESDPSSVTKEDANQLHSLERRAHGVTEKGGVTAQAQQIVSEKEKQES